MVWLERAKMILGMETQVLSVKARMTQDTEIQVLLERVRMVQGMVTVASSARAKMTQDTEAQAEQIFLVGFSSFC